MRIIITGAAGFIGTALTKALLERGSLADRNGQPQPIREILLVDRVAPPLPPAAGIALRRETGDLGDAAFRARVFAQPFDSLFHLAATLTTEAERDLRKGIEVNVLGFLALLEACRTQPQPPRLVFASSIATFGGALPETVEDDTLQRPQTSYGIHKVIAEKLIDDHSRHGVIDGRALRLPVVIIRPPGSAPSVSDRVAAITREPLLGQAVDCPLQPDTRVPVVSVSCVAESLIRMHDLPVDAFGDTRAMNLPALNVTVAEMIEALRRVAGEAAAARIRMAPDAQLQAIVDGWPHCFESARARRHGILPDESFDTILTEFLSNRAAY